MTDVFILSAAQAIMLGDTDLAIGGGQGIAAIIENVR